jgi:hypothetical protein
MNALFKALLSFSILFSLLSCGSEPVKPLNKEPLRERSKNAMDELEEQEQK